MAGNVIKTVTRLVRCYCK